MKSKKLTLRNLFVISSLLNGYRQCRHPELIDMSPALTQSSRVGLVCSTCWVFQWGLRKAKLQPHAITSTLNTKLILNTFLQFAFDDEAFLLLHRMDA